MPKSNKQVIIDAIIKQLENGKERGNILATVGKKWQLSTRTFDRLLKIAQQQHTIKQQAIKDAIAKDTTIKELESRKQAIMTAIERKEKLTKIANGEQMAFQQLLGNGKIAKGLMVPTLTEQMKAIAELNKMEGDYAPTKVANTDTDGNNVKSQILLYIPHNDR